MPLPPLPNYKFSYEEFTVDPNQESEADGFGRLYATPMTMTTEDGSILYETGDFNLLFQIICSNDTKTLERYLVAAPRIILEASKILIGYQGIHDNEDCLLEAVQTGCLNALKMLLSHFMQLREGDLMLQVRFKQRRYKLLNRAAKWGHIEVVKYLLDNQPLYADIHARGSHGHTALLCAADLYFLSLAVKWASPELIKRLIASGADPNTKVMRGPGGLIFWNQHDPFNELPALFDACTHANFKFVETLINCRDIAVGVTDVLFTRDNRGSIPLHWATQSRLPAEFDGFPDLEEIAQNIANTVELLLSLDPATINVQDNDGNTPLHYATRSEGRHNKLYIPVFKLLCDNGSDASVRNKNDETPLHTLFLLHRNNNSFTDQDPVDPAAISIMLAHGASPTDTDNAGNTPLHLAASNLHWTEALLYLLERGADPAQKNLKQETALHRAACGSYKGTHLLVRSDERIRAQENVLAILVKAGGDELMDQADAEGKTPRQICKSKRDEWILRDIR
ncbi:related to ankyrin [Fusarium mangiferae]|uniref:Related to ankyrin n=1 Tax=Fusarium mangiferae TaxID=192010 RepID=A0A1L7THP7_FUSMA|nr:uncharacterized protein FMAN_13148 [Fusarium mangiferae]CVK94827.1 related to ankyrin [Fusarium mangiferae]